MTLCPPTALPRTASVGAAALMTELPASVDAPGPDLESRAWVAALAGDGVARERAVERLHGLLVRGARFEIGRRRQAHTGGLRTGSIDDLAVQAADDALMAILRKLDTYRGDSRFTTWAYKFVLLEASVKLRRRAWQDREIPLEEDGLAWLERRASGSPGVELETAELLGAVGEAIASALTPHQRSVLVAITLNDVPIDVLAERMATTRGALYKTLHDARRKLRARLAEAGLAPDPGGPS